jgi:wyosine [tRNA(Phe)-imidazoG37] synthetase (radical SAM superfamily)
LKKFKYLYGPVPSRRMGLSLGISPIPSKYCNYSCVYCQLGKTKHMTNDRREFFALEDILLEAKEYINNNLEFDVITIVGEGEPTLYSKLGELLENLKKLSDKPIAVITNGALLYDSKVRDELYQADIVLPTLDAFDERSYRKINRPYGKITYEIFFKGLQEFSKNYKGQLWLEVMLVKGINDSEKALVKLKEKLGQIEYDKVYINVPARPPAEKWVEMPKTESIKMALEILGGISIESLVSEGFYSEIKDDYEAILSIIKRHPMNNFEIKTFLEQRKSIDIRKIFEKLDKNDKIEKIEYKGYITYRVKQ